jgi:hypothetical protein
MLARRPELAITDVAGNGTTLKRTAELKSRKLR